MHKYKPHKVVNKNDSYIIHTLLNITFNAKPSPTTFTKAKMKA